MWPAFMLVLASGRDRSSGASSRRCCALGRCHSRMAPDRYTRLCHTASLATGLCLPVSYHACLISIGRSMLTLRRARRRGELSSRASLLALVALMLRIPRVLWYDRLT